MITSLRGITAFLTVGVLATGVFGCRGEGEFTYPGLQPGEYCAYLDANLEVC